MPNACITLRNAPGHDEPHGEHGQGLLEDAHVPVVPPRHVHAEGLPCVCVCVCVCWCVCVCVCFNKKNEKEKEKEKGMLLCVCLFVCV